MLGVFICMPPTLPVHLGSMNYTSVVLVGLFAIIICLWFILGREQFEGPHIDWDMMNSINGASTSACPNEESAV